MIEYIVREGFDIIVLIKEVDEPDVDINNITIHRTTLDGPEFKRDNVSIYTMLRKILTSTTARDIVSIFFDKSD